MNRAAIVACMSVSLGASSLAAQVDLEPATVQPAAWERFALRVVNQTDSVYVGVRLLVPEAIMVLGVEPMAGWTISHTPATEATPQEIVWSGGAMHRGEYLEFAFLGRVPADARRERLFFPVEVTRESGSIAAWTRDPATGDPPTVQIVGSTSVTAWGSLALAGVAAGLAVLAIGLAVSGRSARTGA